MAFKGKAWKFGDNVNTDEIIPARYLSLTEAGELAKHVMEDADPLFPSKVQEGDVLVAGKNSAAGLEGTCPGSYQGGGHIVRHCEELSRIFFRNSFNMGLLIFESKEAADGVKEGDLVEVDPDQGVIRNISRGETYKTAPIPPFMRELVQDGGLVAHIRKKAESG